MSSPGAPLYKGRIMHLKGRFFDEKEAIAYYQGPGRETGRCGRGAEKCQGMLRTFPAVEGPGRRLDARSRTRQLQASRPRWQAQQLVDAIIQGKLAASYWLGLIQYEQGEYDYEAWKSQGKFARGAWTISCGAGLLPCPHAAIRRRKQSFGPPGRITTSPAPWKPADSGRRRSTQYESSIFHCGIERPETSSRPLAEGVGRREGEETGRGRSRRKRRWRERRREKTMKWDEKKAGVFRIVTPISVKRLGISARRPLQNS